MDPQKGTGFFPILEDAALSEPLRRALVAGVVCGIEIYEWVRRREPLRKVLPQFCNILKQFVSCKHLGLHGQRQGYYEITNACHPLNLSRGRLRPLQLFVTLL